MNRISKSSLVLIFTMLFSIFMLQGWYNPEQADAAVVAAQPFPNTPTISGTTSASVSGSYTVNAGTNRLLVVVISASYSATTTTTATANYGGQALTQAVVVSGASMRRPVWIGYLNEAGIAAASNTTLQVTLSSGTSLVGTETYAAVFTGVNQATPVNATYQFYDSNTDAVMDFGTGLAVQAGGYSLFGVSVNNATAPTITGDTGYTVTTLNQIAASADRAFTGAKAFAAAGTANPTITYSATIRGGLAAATINPAPSGDSVNVADGTDPANYNVARGSTDNIADSFTMVSTNTDNGAAAVTGVTASLTNSANISGIRLYKDNGVVGTYEAGTDTLLSTGTPGASVSFTGFTENLTTTASNYLILVDVASGATLSQTVVASVTALTVTSPDAQGTITDTGSTLTIIDVPHENVGTALNTAIATSPKTEGTLAVLMQRFQVTSSTSGAGAQDNQLELNSLGIDDLGTATGARTAKAYIDTTSSATLPGTAVLIGTLSSWTGTPTSITLNQGTAGDRTVANGTPKYIYIVYDLPAGATQTVQSSITSVGVVSPDAGQTGLTLNSNAITLSSDPSIIISCAECHGYGATFADGTARNNPAGTFQGSHNTHVATYSKVCSVCHTAPATETSADFKHRNETVQIASPINGLAGSTYSKTSFTQSNTFTPGFCSNTYCHSNGTSVISGSIPANSSATWGGTTTCESCHGVGGGDDGRPNYANNTPKRNTHGDGASYGVTHKATACPTCHTGVTGTAGAYTISDTTTHNNGAYNIQASLGYTQATGVCATPGCHGSVAWGGNLGCTDCHNVAQSTTVAQTLVGGAGITQRRAIVPEFQAASNHVRNKAGGVTNADCGVCHMEGSAATGAINATYHKDGYIDLRDPDSGSPIQDATHNGANPGAYASSGTALNANATPANRLVRFSRNLASNALEIQARSIMINQCLHCHDAGGATNAAAQVTGGAATNPFNATAASMPAGRVMDVDAHFTTTNRAYHPIKGKQNNSFTQGTRMAAPWNMTKTTGNTTSWGYLMTCWDCHTTDNASGTLTQTVTAHGSAITVVAGSQNVTELRGVVWRTGAVATNPTTLCIRCHALYDTSTTTNHSTGSAYSSGGSSSMSVFLRYGCTYCHSSNPNPTSATRAGGRSADVHGYSVGYNGTAFATNNGYGFFRNASTSNNGSGLQLTPNNVGGVATTTACFGTVGATNLTNGTTSCGVNNMNNNQTFTAGGDY
jgi:predicted CxxxxCH...CXXCH cytochrome family protein